MHRRIFALIAVLGIAPQAAPGQADVTLSNDTRILVHGELTRSHARSNHGHHDGGYHQHYFYSGISGDSVWITTVAAPPQPSRVAVAIFAPGGSTFLADDGGRFVDPLNEGRPSWYASVESRLPSTGQYVICVHSHDGASTGSYALSVSTYGSNITSGPASSPPTASSGYPFAARATTLYHLQRGSFQPEDALTPDGKYYDTWLHEPRETRRSAIHVQSDAVDTELELYAVGGLERGDIRLIARDDDSGAGTSACVEMTLNAGTTYLLVARAKYPNATGSYRAQITYPSVRACGD